MRVILSGEEEEEETEGNFKKTGTYTHLVL
jgi:hypothetical protein